jgi:hypothetical protein
MAMERFRLRRRTGWMLLGASVTIAGCGGSTAGGPQAQGGTGGTGCPAGSEACACYGNDTCDAGLTCASHLCVNLGTGGSAQGGMSASGGATTGGNGGIILPGTGASGPITTQGLVPITRAQADQLTGAACEGWQGEPEPGPAVLEFQVDITSSMGAQTASTGNQSKWQAMQSALPQALGALPAAWAVGLAFFSTPRAGQCYQGMQAVPIAANTPDHVTALTNAIQQQTPNGYTPTEAAYDFALQQVQVFGSNNNYIVIVTDGVPSINADAGCTLGGTGLAITQSAYNAFIANVAAQTASTGVRTFVVGVPGSEELQQADYDPMYELSRLAEAGQTAMAGCTSSPGTLALGEVNPRGTYCHYDMTQTTSFADAMQAAIGSIAGGIVSCNYTVPVSSDPNQVVLPGRTNLVYDDGTGQKYLVQPNTSAACDVGWHFTDATNTAIEICSTTCAIVQANWQGSLTLVFGCSTGVIPP